MRYALLIFLFLCISPLTVRGEEINAGFVQGLWYSSDQIIEGVPIRVYAALRYNTPHDLIGTVRFMDNGKRIGSSPVSALSGRLVETWIDWTPSSGEHSLSVMLGDAELHVIGGEVIQADVTNIVVNDTLIADIDTDEDGIGNMKDTDDDGDDVSDEEEARRGSNPLVADKKVEVVEEKNPEVLAEPTPAPVSEGGLEQYLGDGTVHNLLGNVTEKVADAKQSLDAYRERRNEALYNSSTSTETEAGSMLDTATITRSKIETNDTFLSAFISGVRALLQNIWTFKLWVFSHILSHPALIQFILLLGILSMIYRIARRLGNRRYN